MIETGTVLNLKDNNMSITDDWTVLKDNIPVGTLENNLKWFKNTPSPEKESIKEVVFIREYVWGYREFKSKLSEFRELPDYIQENILEHYVELVNNSEDY